MEFQENGLNTFDFHARMYDPQIGRSFQPDPHADSYAAKSPFSFLANNPINFTDPTGMDEVEWDDEGGPGGNEIFESTGERKWFIDHFRGAGGFNAAFNPRGQWRAENARSERSRLGTWQIKFKDWYFKSKYTDWHYTNSTIEGREFVLNEASNLQVNDGTQISSLSFEFKSLGTSNSMVAAVKGLAITFDQWYILNRKTFNLRPHLHPSTQSY
jgi:RHS repeat-associated protein